MDVQCDGSGSDELSSENVKTGVLKTKNMAYETNSGSMARGVGRGTASY